LARRPRVFVPGYPHHIVQRGHDRKAVFVESADYAYYLANLAEFKVHYDVAVYAWCLMTNHVHLILCPGNHGSDISALMRRVSARQARYVNRLEQRSGTLWEGRFRCSVVDTDAYLLACMRYVDLNPVRAGLCRHPGEYCWSSYAQKVGQTCDDDWLDPDPVTLAMGEDDLSRQRAYARFVMGKIDDDEQELIRTAVRRNQLTGRARFVDEIEQRTGLRIEARGPGRPKKTQSGEK
jgi:putative transposase